MVSGSHCGSWHLMNKQPVMKAIYQQLLKILQTTMMPSKMMITTSIVNWRHLIKVHDETVTNKNGSKVGIETKSASLKKQKKKTSKMVVFKFKEQSVHNPLQDSLTDQN
jgi:hypothetical protein